MRKYEFTYILDPSVDDARSTESLERYIKIIRDQRGEVSRQENWGRRRFAYDIDKKGEGTYIFIKMRCDTKAIDELHRVLRFDETVLRSLIVLDDDAEARNAAAARHAIEAREGGRGDGPRGEGPRGESGAPQPEAVM